MRRLFTLAALFLVGCAASGTAPPLPSDVRVIAPAPSVPNDIAAFSGQWSGTLDNGVRLIVVVEEVQADRAIVVVSGSGPPPSWGRYEGAFVDGALRISISTPSPSGPVTVTQSYRMQPDGTLAVNIDFANQIVRGRLTTGSPAAAIGPTPGVRVPLPPDVYVFPPGPSVPKELAAFSGQWEGTFEWPGGELLNHVLIVEWLDDTGAALVIAAAVPGSPGHWDRYAHAQFEGGVLTAARTVYDLSQSWRYRMERDGTLLATVELNGRVLRARLRRVGSPPVQWVKAGVTEQQFGTDRYVCVQKARVTSGGIAMSEWVGGPPIQVAVPLYNACMESRGYRLENAWP